MLKKLVPLAYFCLQSISLLYADTWTTPATVIPGGPFLANSDIDSSYDSQDNQFLVTWTDNSGNSYFFIYNPVSQTWNAIIPPHPSPVLWSVYSSYGSATKQFLVTWADNTGNPTYMAYSPSTNTITPLSGPTAIPSAPISESDVYCSYDSANNLFLVTWLDIPMMGFNEPFYAVYDPTHDSWPIVAQIPGSSVPVNDIYSSYGSVNKQFLVTWADIGIAEIPTYIIYDASNNTWTGPNVIPGNPTSSSDVFVSYDSVDNIFLVTWQDNLSSLPYYAIYDPALGSWTGPSAIPNALSSSSGENIFSSFDGINDQFLVTWVDSSGATMYNNYYPATNTWSAPASIPNATVANSNIFSSYDPTNNEFLVTWSDFQGHPGPGFTPIYAVFSPSPLPISALTGKQVVNDFVIVSERFNLLKWIGSTSTNVVGYNIYRNGVLIATVGPNVFSYEDHNQKKGVPMTYSISAVNTEGQPSTLTTVIVK